MKNIYKYFVLALLIFGYSQHSFAQSATATYSTGTISTQLVSNPLPGVQSACSVDLTVNVPAGQFVTGVDIEYNMTATGGAWLSEQRSYVECVTTGNSEAAIAFGPLQNVGGNNAYNRQGLSIANGIVPAAGSLTFRLHAFRVWGGSGCSTGFQFIPNNTYKVTVYYTSPPTCPQPTNPVVTAVTANSVDLGWTSGGASNWQVRYWPLSNPANKTLVNVNTNPYSLTGLNPSTSYVVEVRDSCGLGDVSFWTSFLSVKTSCATIPAPWTENFDSPDWVAAGFNGVGSVDTCFTRNWDNNLTWETGPPSFISSFTGPSADHTSGSGKFIFSDVNAFGTFPDTAIITTPPIDLSPLNIPELTFWYHMFGTSIGSLKVQVSSNGGTSFTDVVTITGQQQNSNNDPWKEQIVSLAAYANSTVIVRLLSIQQTFGFQGDVAIDDMSIQEQPTCPKPSNLQVVARSFDQITLGWTSGGASNWQIEYGAPGFTPGTGTLVNVSSNPVTISGLSTQTAYDFVVRDSCGSNDLSAWSQSVLGVTLCGVQSTPYSENFDGAAFNRGSFNNSPGSVDTCWSRDLSGNFFVKTGPAFFTFTSGATNDHTTGTASGKYIYSERTLFTGNSDTAEIVSPLIDLSSLSNPELRFWYHMFGSDINRLLVYVSNNQGLTYNQVYTRVGQQQSSNADAWKEAIINLSAYANDTILVKFSMLDQGTGFNSNISIDDFDIDEAPTCPKPQDLKVVGYTNSSVTLTWTSGGATNWDIEYGSAGFTQGNGTIVTATTNPFTVTGLSPNTAYDFYVRDSCGPGDLSLWDGPAGDTTDCNPVAAPILYTFDGPAWVPGTFFSMGSINSCWDRDYQQNYAWKANTSNTTFNSGPSSDHTTGSGKFMNADRLFGTGLNANTGTELYSPLIDLSPLTIPELSFWYHMFGTDIDSLVLEVFNGTSWSTEFSLQGAQQNSKTDAWKEAVVNLSAYAGDTIKLRFRAVRTSTTGFAVATSLDDVNIREQPTCPQPSNLSVVSSGANDITLSWTSGGATNWQIEYGPAGFVQGNGTILNVATNPYTVTGLNSASSYDFYLRDSCSATDQSVWIGPVTASTSCLPIAAPFLETFDGAQWVSGPNFNDTGDIANCWLRYPLLDYFWRSGPPPFGSNFSGPSGDHTSGSGKYLFAESSFGGGTAPFDAFVETPPIDLSPLNVPELRFWYHMFGSGIGSLEVQIDNGSGFSVLQTWTGQQQTGTTDPWKEAIIGLSAYANDTVVIRFKASKSTFTTLADAAIDDLEVLEAPTCPQPSNLSVVSSGANDVTISWNTGGATNWQIEYGLAGFVQGNGTVVNATTNPFTITGLNSASTYDFYVRDSCSATDLSAWVGPVTGATSCLPVAAPFSESFDGAQWVVGPNFNDTGAVANCWVRYPIADYFWRPGPPPFASTFTGPSGDHTSGSGKYLFAESSFGGGSPPFDAFVETPPIDLSPLNVPELTFWYHMYGTGIGSLEVQIDNGNGFTTLQTWNGAQQVSGTDPWNEAVISLSAYANDTVVLRFKANKSSFSTLADAAIDDLSIDEAPNCPKPFNVSAIPTSDGFVVSWTSGGATNWQIEYGPVGFNPGNGTLVNVATNPYTITGLNANTGYDIYVRDSCSATDVSDWVGPLTDTTLCSVFATPYTENFDGASWVNGTFITDPGVFDPCWDRDGTGGYFWKPRTNGTGSFNTGPNSDHTTGNGKYVFSENFGGAVDSTAFFSPAFDLSTLTNPEMRFWYHMYGADIDKLNISIWNGGGWSTISTINGQQQTNSSAAWAEQIVSLSSYQNDTVRFRFVAHRSAGGFLSDIAVDDFWIGEAPSCPRPTNLTSTASTTTSITLSWTTGGATNWLVGYRPSGSGVPLVIVPVGTNPFTVTGLAPSTSYDFYVKDSCAAGDVSLWTGPLSISTLCGVATAPWSESFDGADWVPGTGALNTGNLISQCWSRPSVNNPNFGTTSGPTTSTTTGPSSGFGGGGKYIYTESSGGSSGSGTITSPSIYIPSNLVNPRLKFAYHMYGAGIQNLKVDITTLAGSTTELTITGQQQFSSAAPWQFDSVSLNAYLGDTIEFTFDGSNNSFSGDIAIDEVSIISDPTNCGDPSNISFTNITPTSARVNWISPNPSSEIEVVLSGQPQGSGDLYAGVTSPFDISNLQPATTYVVYVRDSCTNSAYSNWISDTLVTLPCPVVNADFSFSGNFLTASFNSSATTNADSVYWQFGDGTDTSFANPVHLYPAGGAYTVSLFAFNVCDVDTFVDTIVVCDTLAANFTSTQVGDTITFDASSSQGAILFFWDFGDGTDTSGLIVDHVYASAGSKLVTLTVVNACFDTVTTQKTITICLPPVAEWTATVLGTGANGMNVQFDASASKNATSYEWDFGDGNTLTGVVQPLHTYVTPGLFYIVKLTVTNDCGDTSVKRYRLSEIGIDEYTAASRVNVYPNPANDQLNIEWDPQIINDPNIALYGADGRLLLQYQTSGNFDGLHRLDISHLPSGVYTLRMSAGDRIITEQVIVE